MLFGCTCLVTLKKNVTAFTLTFTHVDRALSSISSSLVSLTCPIISRCSSLLLFFPAQSPRSPCIHPRHPSSLLPPPLTLLSQNSLAGNSLLARFSTSARAARSQLAKPTRAPSRRTRRAGERGRGRGEERGGRSWGGEKRRDTFSLSARFETSG